MRYVRFGRIPLFLLLAAASAAGAEGNRVRLSHPLALIQPERPAKGSAERSLPRSSTAVPETLRVLAARIQFLTDTDDRTTGDGTFDQSAPSQIFDPPPHDRNYFEAHLNFLQNYFRKVSGGRLIVEATLLDSVYTLPHQMRYYTSPQLQLAAFVRDSWTTVDSVTPGIPFSQYQSFLIFHAGAGRDLDFVSLLGYDPTPFDLPSLTLNLAALQAAYGSSYPGIPVNAGSFLITNTMVLPETENHVLQTGSGGSAILQFGINGLLAASLGSYLGLPDLFDTKNGATGIGRFGLMDGQSIFSWSGLFPPEPSAWEKYFLGWVDPVRVSTFDSVWTLPAVTTANEPDTIALISLSAKEYFLVENRNRDANRDGASVTLLVKGATVVKHWARDTTGFNTFEQDSLYGVVTDVDEFDWSLPGGVDGTTGEFFDGGILIWHIDENVIDAGYAADAVNADPDHRGVNLMEADGSQDIGQSYGFLSAGSGSENGTPLDFWYAGNDAPLRKKSNAFTPTSHPSSLSNSNADSHISLLDFAPRGPRMTVRIQVGDDQISPLRGYPKFAGRVFGTNALTVAPLTAAIGATQGLLLPTGRTSPARIAPGGLLPQPVQAGELLGWRLDGSPLLAGLDSSGFLARDEGEGTFVGKAAAADLNGDGTTDIALGGTTGLPVPPDTLPGVGTVRAWSISNTINSSALDTLFRHDLAWPITCLPVVSDSFVAFGAKHGTVYLYRHDGTPVAYTSLGATDTSDIVGVCLVEYPDALLALSSAGHLLWVRNGFACVALSQPLRGIANNTYAAGPIAGTIDTSSEKRIVVASRDGQVYELDLCGHVLPNFPVATGGAILSSPALADIDGDGRKDIVVFSGNRIAVINAAGAYVDNFPVTVPTSLPILSSPIVADLDGDGTPDIVAVTQEGLVVAYDRTGKMVRGFPLQAGINSGSTPVTFASPGSCAGCTDLGLALGSDDGAVYAWKTGSVLAGVPAYQPWPQLMHDARNTGLDDSRLAGSAIAAGFFPSSRAYNWPNPVRAEDGYRTRIRYFVQSEASVHIKIFDMAGDKVAEFDGPGNGGMDNEVVWDVSAIQSGVYFAHITASGTGGSGGAVIKIAVVK